MYVNYIHTYICIYIELRICSMGPHCIHAYMHTQSLQMTFLHFWGVCIHTYKYTTYIFMRTHIHWHIRTCIHTQSLRTSTLGPNWMDEIPPPMSGLYRKWAACVCMHVYADKCELWVYKCMFIYALVRCHPRLVPYMLYAKPVSDVWPVLKVFMSMCVSVCVYICIKWM
jgi:hypothetical protein